MATAKVGGEMMEGYFKQKKKGNSSTSISKPSPKVLNNTSPHSPYIGLVLSPAIVTHKGSLHLQDSDNDDENEELLRQFDMNMAYGPCIGITRLERWNRANKLGLNPRKEVEMLLKSGKLCSECLWDNLVWHSSTSNGDMIELQG